MDRLMKKLGLLALCTGLSFAVHAVTPQAEAPAEQNVKIDSVVVTGARYASDIRPPADDRVGGRPGEDRTKLAAFAAADPDRAGSGAVHHRTRDHGLRRVGRRRGRHLPARAERRLGAADGAHRRAPAVHGADGAPDRRCLPVADGRTGRSAARPGIGALRFERDGRRGEHRPPRDARAGREDLCRHRLRLL